MSRFSPVVGGKIIGKPYQGTHGRAFNQRGGSDNWESENAVDIAVPIGTPIYAVTNGTIGSQFGSLGTGGRFAGLRLHLDNGNNHFYYAHLSKFAPGIQPGAKVHAGELLGYSGEANGVAHLHFATSTNLAPMSFANGKEPDTTAADQSQPQPTTPDTTPDTSGADSQRDSLLAQDISGIQQVGGPPLASPPLHGATEDTNLLPQNQTASTWQMIATNGQVSQDTLRLAQQAQLGANATPSG